MQRKNVKFECFFFLRAAFREKGQLDVVLFVCQKTSFVKCLMPNKSRNNSSSTLHLALVENNWTCYSRRINQSEHQAQMRLFDRHRRQTQSHTSRCLLARELHIGFCQRQIPSTNVINGLCQVLLNNLIIIQWDWHNLIERLICQIGLDFN